MKTKTEVDQQVTTRVALELTGLDILKMLKDADALPEVFRGVPVEELNWSAKFSVPGGGDWSNTDCDINEEDPIHVVVEISQKKTL